MRVNNSSHIYKDLKTNVIIYFKDTKTRDMKEWEAFTFPMIDLLPSDNAIYLLENPDLTETFQKNISEARKKIAQDYIPKHIYFFFQWHVDIGDEKLLQIEKHKNFVIEGFS